MYEDLSHRWVLIAAFVADFTISIYYREKAKKSGRAISRKEEGVTALALRMAIAVPLYGSLVAYMINPGWMVWSKVHSSGVVSFLGSLISMGTIPFTYWIMTSIGKNISETVLTKDDHELITSGPYRWIRHPLYTDGLLLFMGGTLIAGNWFIGMFTAIAALALLYIVIPREEEQLIEKFGDEYVSYLQQTGRLFPKIRHIGSHRNGR